MDLSPRILGTGLAKQLRERASAPLLRIGSDVFDRNALAHVHCFNFIAAAHLDRTLRELGVKSTRDVFERIPPSALALPQIGAISLAVLGAAFEARGIGGAAPLEAWVRRHALAGDSRGKDPLVTFTTIKHREAAAAKAERRTRKQIKQTRRQQAHSLRLARFHKAS